MERMVALSKLRPSSNRYFRPEVFPSFSEDRTHERLYITAISSIIRQVIFMLANHIPRNIFESIKFLGVLRFLDIYPIFKVCISQTQMELLV